MKIYKHLTANNLPLSEHPFIKELAMESYLLENEDILSLDKLNFNEVNVLDVEIALKKGGKSGGGRIDILVKYSSEYLGIVELKIGEINQDSLIQLQNYLKQKEQILINDVEYWKEENPPKWVGILVGSSISEELKTKIDKGYEYNGIPIAAMTIKRFKSLTNEVFVVTDTYFNYKYKSKDYSKFKFKGQIYNKGRLVNAVIRYLVNENPQITFLELKKLLPDTIQKGKAVFVNKSDADEVYQKTAYKRHYLKSEEIIQLSDATICTSNQWNLETIKKFIEKINKVEGCKVELM